MKKTSNNLEEKFIDSASSLRHAGKFRSHMVWVSITAIALIATCVTTQADIVKSAEVPVKNVPQKVEVARNEDKNLNTVIPNASIKIKASEMRVSEKKEVTKSPSHKTVKSNGKTIPATKKKRPSTTSSKKKHGKKQNKSKVDNGSGNPFEYGADELGGYIPVQGQKMVANIAVKGIITLGCDKSMAVLKLNQKDKSFFVKTGDVIRVQERNLNQKLTDIYLQIKSIKENEVEIIQQQRPDRVIIVR